MVVRTRLDIQQVDSGSRYHPPWQSGYPLLNSRGLRRWPPIIYPYVFIISSIGVGWRMMMVFRSIVYMLFLFRFSVNNRTSCLSVYHLFLSYILFRILIDYSLACRLGFLCDYISIYLVSFLIRKAVAFLIIIGCVSLRLFHMDVLLFTLWDLECILSGSLFVQTRS